MNAFLRTLAFAAGANSMAIQRSTCDCSFHLKTSGDVSLTVGEDSQGEVLGNSQMTQASFCLNGNAIIDTKGNECWFTPPTYVLQCDENATPSTPITIGCDGVVSYAGQTTFYECRTGNGDEVNIYSKPDMGSSCGAITLTADSCHAACPTPTPSPTCPAPSTVTATATVTVTKTEEAQTVTATVSTCPAAPTCPLVLPANYEFPHLIIPVDSANPSSAPGTSYFGEVSSTVSSLFNFDIPAADAGKQCALWFALPTQAQLTTSSFTLSGSGAVDFKSLKSVASQSTSYSNVPAAASDLGQFTLVPGNAYKVAEFACPAGEAVAFEMSGCGDTALKYFQDYNPCPIGLYVVPE